MSSSGNSQKERTSGENSVSSVTHDDEHIYLNGKKFLKSELQTAFGGTMVVERYAEYPKHKFANPAALGLSCFALTTFVLGLYYAGAKHIKIINVVVGSTFFYGGLVQLLAGVWELAIGNCFAGTALASFGPFWFSFGAIFIPSFGIADAYKDDPEQFGNAVGFFLLGWIVFITMVVILCLKTTVMFLALFVTLDVAFILLAISNFTGNLTAQKVGGVFAILAAICGWYNALAGVATKQNSYFIVNPIQLPLIGGKK